MSKLVVLNWKMNLPDLPSWSEALKFKGNNRIVVCPSFTHINKLRNLLKGKGIYIGAQNVSYKENGALTGEVSVEMLKDVGASYAIIGHSERRYVFGETDEIIAKKAKVVLEGRITPILCVGETKKMTREKSWNFIRSQLQKDLSLTPYPLPLTTSLVVAYEPVWSIGGNKNIDASHSAHLIDRIREFLYTNYKMRATILYGGSVNSKNIKSLLSVGEIDGFLVGSASLKKEEVKKLLKLIN
ncbi:MAG: triose-phosphate isomerase [Candidatus Paceibacterota bacterium]|jgi:triosephosphate isomerase